MEAETERAMGATMTDEERREKAIEAAGWALCSNAQGAGPGRCDPKDCCCHDEARIAVEAYLMADALAQSNAEPDPNFDPVEAAEVDARSIEAANAQSDAEPVAWRWRYPHGGWAVDTLKPWGAKSCIIEPLYTLAQSAAPLPREHQDPSKWISKEDMERAHHAQSNAEPVAWQYRWRMNENQPWSSWLYCDRHYPLAHAKTKDMEFRSLYTAPPRPDTSAGLAEAAGMAEQWSTK
jgi:hypothetical protein